KTKKYGDIDLTINLSKPEKSQKDIENAVKAVSTGYPLCALCVENVGYEGDVSHAPRANHRVVPVDLDGEKWYLQYSPYGYYNEHCILINENHVPMRITSQTFGRLLAFVEKFPHYFMGSNAGLPIVGGSILAHDHYQGGNYEIPMAKANPRMDIEFPGYSDIKACIVDWPLSVIRISGSDRFRLKELASKILDAWEGYSDEENDIIAFTDKPHNAITPIARIKDGKFELDLILRNNRTSEEYPNGIFSIHDENRHIKSENIGLIEAMGLAVLPARLVKEHDVSDGNKREEIGNIFLEILDNCGVFKNNEKGNNGIIKFVNSIK
ncbi:MAG: galactose-1-phosphate uridylyltransferase, partial [Clostridia bacterium]|nr:galactose-1-phosphate uridylyltransferase [Clostridia bacterium]